MATNTTPPLLTQRAAIIFGLAILVGLIIGGLTYLAGRNVAAAAASGLTAFGITSIALHQVLE